MADLKALLRDFAGPDAAKLTEEELDAAARYYQQNPQEFERFMLNSTGDILHDMEKERPGLIKSLVNEYVGGGYETLTSVPMSAVAETAKGFAGALTPLGIESPYQAASEWAEYNRPAIQPGSGAEFAFGVGSTVAQNLGLLGGTAGAAAMGALNPATVPAVAVGLMGLTKGGGVAAEHIEQGGTKLGGAAKGVLSGGLAALTERLGLGAGLPTGIGGALGVAAREVPTEIAEEIGDIALDYISGTGQATDFESNVRRLGTTGLTALVSAPIIGAGAGFVGSKLQKISQEQMLQNYQKFSEKEQQEADQLQADLDTPPPEAPIQVVQTETPGIEPATIRVDPNESENVELSMATPKTQPVDKTVYGPDGSVVRDSAGQTVYNPGDKIFIIASQKNVRRGSATLDTPSVMAEVTSINEDGTISAKVEGEDDVKTFNRDQIRSKASMGVKGLDIRMNENAPSTWAMIRVTKELAKDLRTTLKTKEGQLAFTQINKKTGQLVKLGYDWALNRYPGLAQVAITHELGHALSMSDPKTNTNTVHGKLVREYRSSKNFVLMEPITKNKVFESMRDEQERFVTKLRADMQSRGEKWGLEATNRVQRNWDSLMARNGFNGLTDIEKTTIRNDVYKQITEEMNQMGMPRTDRGAYRKKVEAARTAEALNAAYAKKGMFYLPTLRAELEEVHKVMRGLSTTNITRNELYATQSREQMAEEMYADLFTAKVLGLQVRLNGQFVDLMSTYAPNLNKQFDAYIEQNPKFVKAIKAATEYTGDVNKQFQVALEGIREADKRYAERLAAGSPEASWLVSQYGPIGGMLKGLQYRFMNGIFDQNFAAYDALPENKRLQIREKIEQLLGISSIMQDFLEKTDAMFRPVWEELNKSDPEANINKTETVGLYMMLRRIAARERTKDIDYTYTDSQGIKHDSVKNTELFSGDLPMDPKEAQAMLDTQPIFVKHGDTLAKAFETFQQFWSDNIVDQLYKDGMVDKAFYEKLKANRNYATYAVVKDLESSPLFKTVAPAIKEMFGAASNTRNPLGATLEHGIALSFMSRLNTIKREIVENIKLPPELKIEAPRSGRVFADPLDKAFTTVTYKKDGKDFGYWIPKVFVDGIEYGGGTGKLNTLIAGLAATSPYFRRMLTTWQPSFIARNTFKDFQRMFKNAENPETGSFGGGIITKYLEVLADHFTPAGQERLETELSDLRNQALVLSDYDFNLRDASFDNIYESLQKQYSQIYRENTSKEGQDRNFIARNIYKALDFIEGISRSTERFPKRAAARYYKPFLDRGIISREQHNQYVRKAGSPYFMNKGSWHPMTGSIYMFFNPAMQALYEDVSAASKSKTVLMKNVLVAGMSLAFQTAFWETLVGFGGAGDEWAELYRRIPWRDLDNHIVIPFGQTPSGKAIYMKLPLDENTASFKKIARAFMRRPGALDTWMKPVTEATDVSLNPILGVFKDLYDIANGVNPPNYMGKPTIDQSAWDEGGARKLREIGKMLYNRISPTLPIYRFGYSDPQMESKGKPETELQQVAYWMERSLNWPLAQTMLKTGMIGISDQGVHDETKWLTEDNKAYSAKMNRLLKEAANAVIIGDKAALDDAMEAIRTNKPLTPEQVTILKQVSDSFPTLVKRMAGQTRNPWFNAFMAADMADKISMLQNSEFRRSLTNE